MIPDFLLFITNRFLIILKTVDSKDVYRRSINIISWMISNVFLIIFCVVYMLLISKRVIRYNNLITFGVVTICFISVNYILSIRYRKEKYNHVITSLKSKYIYSKFKICWIFCLLLFVPLLSLGLGVVVLKNILY